MQIRFGRELYTAIGGLELFDSNKDNVCYNVYNSRLVFNHSDHAAPKSYIGNMFYFFNGQNKVSREKPTNIIFCWDTSIDQYYAIYKDSRTVGYQIITLEKQYLPEETPKALSYLFGITI